MGVRALNIAAQLRNIDVIANNMANINTGGFRKDRLNFADLFYDTDALIGAKGPGGKIRPSGIELGNGVQILATQKLFSHGGYSKTDSELDLAISKDPGVFFRIRRPDGSVGFTRNGNFTKDEAGTMVTMDGGVRRFDKDDLGVTRSASTAAGGVARGPTSLNIMRGAGL